jgi:hypothetical protein
VVKVLMILGGVLITVFANTDWDREVEDSMTSDV